MEKEFVPYEQALALKELGFDEPCFGYYYPLVDGVSQKFIRALLAIDKTDISEHFQKYSDYTKAPLYSQAFRWFREEYCLSSYIRPNIIINTPKSHQFIIEDSIDDFWFETYEEAELACLKKLIEIVRLT